MGIMAKQGLVLLFLLICLSLSLAVEVGEEAPKFANPDFDNKFFISKDVVGKGWTIISFFATYCEGCKQELPELEALYKELSARNIPVAILIMATDPEGTQLVKSYFEAHPTIFPVLIDRYKTTTKKYAVEDLPTLFLINPAGQIVFKIDKYETDTVTRVRQLILDGMGFKSEPVKGNTPDAQ
jgi:peroxiredoxin